MSRSLRQMNVKQTPLRKLVSYWSRAKSLESRSRQHIDSDGRMVITRLLVGHMSQSSCCT
jgi:hypothetical protein